MGFEELYAQYFDPIYRFVYRRVESKETVHDLVSDIFLKIYKALPNFQEKHEKGLTAWVYTIAQNEVFQYYRTQKNKSIVSLEHAEEIPSLESIKDEMDQSLLHESVKIYLEQLEKDDREIILLKYFDDLSNSEIASMLNLTANNVGVKLFRALEKLKNIMEQNKANFLE